MQRRTDADHRAVIPVSLKCLQGLTSLRSCWECMTWDGRAAGGSKDRSAGGCMWSACTDESRFHLQYEVYTRHALCDSSNMYLHVLGEEVRKDLGPEWPTEGIEGMQNTYQIIRLACSFGCSSALS